MCPKQNKLEKESCLFHSLDVSKCRTCISVSTGHEWLKDPYHLSWCGVAGNPPLALMHSCKHQVVTVCNSK